MVQQATKMATTVAIRLDVIIKATGRIYTTQEQLMIGNFFIGKHNNAVSKAVHDALHDSSSHEEWFIEFLRTIADAIYYEYGSPHSMMQSGGAIEYNTTEHYQAQCKLRDDMHVDLAQLRDDLVRVNAEKDELIKELESQSELIEKLNKEIEKLKENRV